jgi:hypothetical protein
MIFIVTGHPSRTAGTATLPEFVKLLSDFLACCRPVCTDTVPYLCDMTLEVKLIFLEPRNVEFLSRCSALELPGDIFLVVADNSSEDISMK